MCWFQEMLNAACECPPVSILYRFSNFVTYFFFFLLFNYYIKHKNNMILTLYISHQPTCSISYILYIFIDIATNIFRLLLVSGY